MHYNVKKMFLNVIVVQKKIKTYFVFARKTFAFSRKPERLRASCTYICKHSVISAMANPLIAYAVKLQFTSHLRNLQVIR